MSHEAIDRAVDIIREWIETIQLLESAIEDARLNGDLTAASDMYDVLIKSRKELTDFRTLWEL